MSSRTFTLSDELYEYLLSVSLRESDLLRRLREETAKIDDRVMQISPEQGQLMALLVRLLGVHRAIEVGVFTGYSSLSVALALPDEGRLVACDISEEWTDIARRYWKQGGVEDKIELHIGPALKTLDSLIADREAGNFEFAFIDADKENYGAYFERCLTLLRPGGLIAIDNTLWSGAVIDENDDRADTVAIRDFNQSLHGDERVELSLVPIGDGLTLAMKRK